MRVFELIRLEESTEYGTFGILKIDKRVFCVTLEPNDEENIPFISSIPAQQYECVRINSPKFGKTFEVTRVPNRTKILFHAGNVVGNTEGCILLGQYWDKFRYGAEDRAIVNSGNTMSNFMHILEGEDEFHLTIKEVY